MYRIFLLLLFLSSPCIIKAFPDLKSSYDFIVSETYAEKQDSATQSLEVRKSCIYKAQLGENLVLNKLSGVPLQEVLKNIIEVHEKSKSEGDNLPWYQVLEMQRVARDAYRSKYKNEEDVNQFVVGLYHSCLDHGM